MPKPLEDKLKREADAQHLSGKSKDAYVYGTLRKTGWKPGQDKKGIKHGDAGRDLENTEHHERMGHTTEEY